MSEAAENVGRVSGPWATLWKRSLERRLPADQFDNLTELLEAKTTIGGRELSAIVLSTEAGEDAGVDPLVPVYVRRLLLRGYVQCGELLGALLQCSRHGPALEKANGAPTEGETGSRYVSAELEELLFSVVASLCVNHDQPKTRATAQSIFDVVADWMVALCDSAQRAMIQDVADGFHQAVPPETIMVRETIGMLLIGASTNPCVIQLLSSKSHQSAAKKLGEALSRFVVLLGGTSPELASRLDTFQRTYDALRQSPVNGFDDTQVDDLNIGELGMENVVDRPIVNSRAHLAIFFDALLYGLPRINDIAVTSYLQARFKGDLDSLIADLITSAFDVLSIAYSSNESAEKLFLYRSFLVNKLPLLLVSLTAMSFMPLNFLFLIPQALNRLDPSIFPSFSSGFGFGLLADARQDFLFACALHGLISEGNIEQILGENPMQTLPAGGKLNKPTLLEEYQNDTSRMEHMISGLELMDGNAGANAEAITDIFNRLCATKDTMTLKTHCHTLVSKPQALDVLLLFTSPTVLLGPLCKLLDEWKYEDDQGEYQPVYGEFSACLLLLLAFATRFRLSSSDLGLDSSESGFVAWVLDEGAVTQHQRDLSEEEQSHLNGWARGLFELEGIGDDVLSVCPPQSFYRLVPVIFNQCVMCRRSGIMDLETMRNGLELLLESFFLPSVVVGMQWLVAQEWAQQKEWSSVILEVAQKLIKPAPMHGEALAMHTAVLSVVGRRVDAALRDLLTDADASSKQEIDTIREKLQSHTDYCRIPAIHPSTSNTNAWAGRLGAPPSVLDLLCNSFRTLCTWSMPPPSISAPLPASHPYAHIRSGVRLRGAFPTLNTIIEQVMMHTQTGVQDVALDIATAFVCADAATQDAQSIVYPTLRDALSYDRSSAARSVMLATDNALRTENTLLLRRRVEALLTTPPPPPQPAMPDIGITPGMMDDLGAALSADADVSATAAGLDFVAAVPSADNEFGLDAATFAAAVGAGGDTAMAVDVGDGIAEGAGGEVAGAAEDDGGNEADPEDIWSGLDLDIDMDFS